MKLSRIKIQGLLNLEDVDINLSDGGVLVVGPNGSGKTNIIKCLIYTMENCVKKYIRSNDFEVLNYTILPCFSMDESKEHSVRLWFTLNKEEWWILMQLRLLDILSRCKYLLSFLAKKYPQHCHPECRFEDFFQKVVPKLFEISYGRLNTVDITKEDADLILCSRHDNAGSFQHDMDLSCIKFPVEKEQELAVLQEGFRKLLKDQIFAEELRLPSELHRERQMESLNPYGLLDDFLDPSLPSELHRERQMESLNLYGLLDDFLDPSKFVRLTQSPGYWAARSGNRDLPLEFFYTADWRNISPDAFRNVARQTLAELRTKISSSLQESSKKESLAAYISLLLQESVCVLAQSRGFLESEQGSWFWNMKNVEANIMSYSCEKGSEKAKQLEKMKEAMLFMTGLVLDVTKGRSPFSKTVMAREIENALQYPGRNWFEEVEYLRVGLRAFDRPQSKWLGLVDYSGGQRELLMVLSAIHLSGAGTVILDEPGHSLHPPKQAQLRRWLETRCETGQVLFAITHSTEMISPKWLGSLYHMKPVGEGYTGACLRQALKEGPEMVVSRDAHGEEPARVPTTSSSQSTSHAGRKILPAKTIDFLMGVEMRRLFFSSGAIFVEGDSDRRVVQALRDVALEKVYETLENVKSTIQQWREAHKELEMDRWDIIPINGSANWPKAYLAAENLGIPFVVILDADVLRSQQNTSNSELNLEEWKNSRLSRPMQSEMANSPSLEEMWDNVNEILKPVESETENSPPVEEVHKVQDVSESGGVESRVRAEIKKFNLWIWNGDVEDLFFTNVCVRDALRTSKNFRDKMREMRVNCPEQALTDQAKEEAIWSEVREKLHKKSGWKNIPYKLLKEMVRASFDHDDGDHCLRTFWLFIKRQLVNPNTKPRIPSYLMERKMESMCQ